jgi:fructuronate reductase
MIENDCKGVSMEALHLNLKSIQEQKASWEAQGFKLPQYDIEKVRENTKKHPRWVHFGAGNIFRAFPARIQDELLDEGLVDYGVIVAETFQPAKLKLIFDRHDCLSTAVTLKGDGDLDLRVVGAIAETVEADGEDPDQWARIVEIFRQESLSVVSFTITEKGYSIRDSQGKLQAYVEDQMKDPFMKATNTPGLITKLLAERFEAGAYPLTLVSMDNCSHNGDLLKASVLAYAKAWVENGFLPEAFLAYVEDGTKISFPWSMIDKITPVADEAVGKLLLEKGYQDIHGEDMGGRIQPPSYANAEETEYLVIEDSFTNGRPLWDKKGIIFTDRETVDRVETMKVTTCLNPLHTALAVFGCLLGYNYIHDEMKDEDLLNLIKGIGYVESLPVVVNPGILDPKEFIDTVIEVRFPNPFLPDTPQRIATDTSQKVSVRYGKTLTQYLEQAPEKLKDLVYIPTVLAGWLRYLLAVDDEGQAMAVSPDPLKESLQEELASISLGNNEGSDDILRAILSRPALFGVDLAQCGLIEKVIEIFHEMNEGPGKVRAYLEKLPRVE